MNASFKKQLSQLYNEVNQEIYSTGVSKQKIDVVENRIVIFAQTKRSPLISALGRRYPELTLSVDGALAMEYKHSLKERIEEQFGLTVTAIFKDYDAVSQHACTVIYVKEPLDTSHK
ncbi:Na-translocating system protein MpsC family protein [Domibacillus sp. 8LH]|uniref:Na-translocating system protein MpsC family protein n=1 Tax=unclassified Domibacillus TaxID=2632383 RepID=UPI002810A384|nr:MULTISPECIES: Na-translocating system protein MpsC family protein [unclassified Domibacillus]WNS80889.1 Na-translocating system protein MpsC family protein [Domibacillus sp. DTU_2020_1001157_1_SI_ALB_TIR_016]